MERPWKEHAIMHFADKFAQVIQFVCDRWVWWAVPQAVGYCMLLPPSTQAYACIRPHPPIRNCWLSASKHSHETFCHQDAATVYIMNLLRESIASKLPEIIWSHTRCLQLKRSQRNCILALCRNGCELQLINREKARRQIVMQQRASSYLC